MPLRPYGHLAVWPFGRLAGWPFDSLAVRPLGRLAIWSFGRSAVWPMTIVMMWRSRHSVARLCVVCRNAFDQRCGRVASWGLEASDLPWRSTYRWRSRLLLDLPLVVELPGRRHDPRAPTPEPRDQQKGHRPQNWSSKMLNVKKPVCCFGLLVFPSLSGLGPGLCSCLVCGPLLGHFLCSWSCALRWRRPENRSFPQVSTMKTQF